jgi:hypothetical protein
MSAKQIRKLLAISRDFNKQYYDLKEVCKILYMIKTILQNCFLLFWKRFRTIICFLCTENALLGTTSLCLLSASGGSHVTFFFLTRI